MARPTTFKPEFCKKLLDLGKKGVTGWGAWGRELGIPPTTLQSWAVIHPAFDDAVKNARHYAMDWMEQNHLLALRHKDDAAISDTRIIFYLKNCFKDHYGDKVSDQPVQHTTNNYINVPPSTMSVDDWEEKFCKDE